eukprot:1830016-Prymnesium_polylepis.1
MGCSTPRVAVGVGIAALAVSEVVFTLDKPSSALRVLTIKMGGTAKGNATWYFVPSTVPPWLVLDAYNGSYTATSDEADATGATALTSGFLETPTSYTALLELRIVSVRTEVFHVPVMLTLKARPDGLRSVWGAIGTVAGVPRPLCTTATPLTTTVNHARPPALLRPAVVLVEAELLFTTCDIDDMPVAHSLPISSDARQFSAVVQHAGDGTNETADVIAQPNNGVYYVSFTPPALGEYRLIVRLADLLVESPIVMTNGEMTKHTVN